MQEAMRPPCLLQPLALSSTTTPKPPECNSTGSEAERTQPGCILRCSTPESGHTTWPQCQRFPLRVLRICWVPACSFPAGVGQALITRSRSSRFCALSSFTYARAGHQCLQDQVSNARPRLYAGRPVCNCASSCPGTSLKPEAALLSARAIGLRPDACRFMQDSARSCPISKDAPCNARSLEQRLNLGRLHHAVSRTLMQPPIRPGRPCGLVWSRAAAMHAACSLCAACWLSLTCSSRSVVYCCLRCRDLAALSLFLTWAPEGYVSLARGHSGKEDARCWHEPEYAQTSPV